MRPPPAPRGRRGAGHPLPPTPPPTPTPYPQPLPPPPTPSPTPSLNPSLFLSLNPLSPYVALAFFLHQYITHFCFFAHPPISPICRTPLFPYLTLYSFFLLFRSLSSSERRAPSNASSRKCTNWRFATPLQPPRIAPPTFPLHTPPNPPPTSTLPPNPAPATPSLTPPPTHYPPSLPSCDHPLPLTPFLTPSPLPPFLRPLPPHTPFLQSSPPPLHPKDGRTTLAEAIESLGAALRRRGSWPGVRVSCYPRSLEGGVGVALRERGFQLRTQGHGAVACVVYLFGGFSWGIARRCCLHRPDPPPDPPCSPP